MSSLKKISGYPENAVSWALNQLPAAERSEFNKTLEKLGGFLGENAKKESTKKLPSGSEIFNKHIIPVIRDGIIKLERLGVGVRDVHLDIGSLKTNFSDMSMDELASLHERVVMLENDAQTIANFVKYYRGLVYLTVHGQSNTEEFVQWFQKQQVSKSTGYRYIAFSTCIMRYPKLILCDLNFSQIVKHKERIQTYMHMETNSKIAHQLAEPVEFRVGATLININSAEPDIPHIDGVRFDIDWKILVQYEDIDITGISPASTKGALAIVSNDLEYIDIQGMDL